MEAVSPHSAVSRNIGAEVPEQSLFVACLLTMSGGFLDAYSWLSLGGAFANSQTGNVVFLGMYAAAGQWLQAVHHLAPIVAFAVGASVASIVRAPLFCLAGEIACLAVVVLTLHRLPQPVAMIGISFGVALQTASFGQVGRWKYLSVTVTGNMLRGIGQLVLVPDREALLGAKTMAAICLMFLLGAAAGGALTAHLGAGSLVAPIGLLTVALIFCGLRRRPR
jgi:uncharacterized membrane protein YoaK (UPF0700 family)